MSQLRLPREATASALAEFFQHPTKSQRLNNAMINLSRLDICFYKADHFWTDGFFRSFEELVNKSDALTHLRLDLGWSENLER